MTVDGAVADVTADGSLACRQVTTAARRGARLSPRHPVGRVAAGDPDSGPSVFAPPPRRRRRAPRATAPPAPNPLRSPRWSRSSAPSSLPAAFHPGLNSAWTASPVVGSTRDPGHAGTHWIRCRRSACRQILRRWTSAGTKRELTPPETKAVSESVAAVVIFTPDTTIQVGGSAQLRAGVKSEAGTYLDRPVTWESGNPAVAVVEADGRLKAKSSGRIYVGHGAASGRTACSGHRARLPRPPAAPATGERQPPAAGATGRCSPPRASAARNADLAVAASARPRSGAGNERRSWRVSGEDGAGRGKSAEGARRGAQAGSGIPGRTLKPRRSLQRAGERRSSGRGALRLAQQRQG